MNNTDNNAAGSDTSVNKEKEIKIYVVCHKDSYVPDNKLLYPIQVGCSEAERLFPEMLHDNDGENISAKNKSYCELTAQYWAWKNDDADYYGFFHYRRYLSFSGEPGREDGYGNIVYDSISRDTVKDIRLDEAVMKDIIENNDIITVKGRKYQNIHTEEGRINVYREYGRAAFQHKRDLDTTIEVLKELHPDYAEAADEYMKSDVCYECNMFIMKKELYFTYCEWLFGILSEVEKRIDTTYYSVEEYRVFGYLAERLFGIFYTRIKKSGVCRTCELPKTLFKNTDKEHVIAPVFDSSIPVVLSANNKFAPYLGVMICSVVSNSSKDKNYDIIVLNRDISDRNKRLIKQAADGRRNISIRFFDAGRYFEGGSLYLSNYLSIETYFRLMIPDIMPSYSRVLYLDCDMVVNRDVAELYETDLQGNIIGAARDIDIAGQVSAKQYGWDEYAKDTVGLDSPYDYFQAGVLIIDLDRLRETASCREMMDIAASNKWRCHDQDVLNRVCRGRVTYLPQKWNVLIDWQDSNNSRLQFVKMAPRQLFGEYLSARNKPYTVHYAGYQKPWKTGNCDMAEYFWRYARETAFYEQLLKGVEFPDPNQVTGAGRIKNILVGNAALRKLSETLFPFGTKRREWLKSLIVKKY